MYKDVIFRFDVKHDPEADRYWNNARQKSRKNDR